MTNRALIFILLILTSNIGYSQSPVRVPSRMTFADIKLKITDKGREAIQEEVDRIMQSPKYFNAKVVKANTYFPIIEKAFNEEGVSPDFKYLSLQESALIPDAVSTSNAVGYWQFKDFTAIEMGLRVDKNIDERMNIYASSRAAARYMKKNNTYFDNWLFALQAYQMGAGAALDVIDKKQYGTKSLTITDKTYWYVRTFLAHKIAYESAIGKSPPNPELIIYKSGKGKSLHDIANESNLEYEQLLKYNKWLKKGKIPDDKEYAVILISGELSLLDLKITEESTKQIEHFMPDFDTILSNKYPEIDTRKHYLGNDDWRKINSIPGVLAQGTEELKDIAKKGGVELSKFLKYNDIRIDQRVVKGQPYYFRKKHTKAKTYYHVVENGESLWSISQKYGISLGKLLTKNRMKSVEQVVAGRVLWLRHIRPANIPIEYKSVKKNSVTAVMKLSEIDKKIEKLAIDDSISIPLFDSLRHKKVLVDSSTELADSSNISTMKYDSDVNSSDKDNTIIVKHQVQVGETLYRISKIYDVEVMEIVGWNDLKLTEDISAGQFLIVHTSKKMAFDWQKPESEKTELSEIKYTVRTGDTMYKITRQFSVSMEDILIWNKKMNHNVSVGEVLVIKLEKKEE